VDNRLILTAELVKPPQIRYSPAGIPIARLWMEHRSEQPEGDRRRGIRFRIEARATGTELCRQLDGLPAGQALRVTGYLARPDRRGDPHRLVVVAERLEPITSTN